MSNVNLLSKDGLCFTETQFHVKIHQKQHQSFNATLECILIPIEISIKVLHLSIPVACFFKIVQAMVVCQFYYPRRPHVQINWSKQHCYIDHQFNHHLYIQRISGAGSMKKNLKYCLGILALTLLHQFLHSSKTCTFKLPIIGS